MGTDRTFTEEEFKAMGMRTLDLLVSSIENKDLEKAKQLAQRMYNEFLGMHDLYRDWLTDLFSFVGRRSGDGALGEAMAATVAGLTRRLSQFYKGKAARQRIQILAAGLRGHLQPFEISEDDEKYTITGHCCGSGGRLISEGKYEAPDNFLKIETAQEMTFNRPDFPVYCAHCYFQNISPAEPGGEPLFVTEPGERPGVDPCLIHIYKDPS
ncbi:MAG: hypothetical protein GY866_24700 [Proteobacteria bacterium]|nr:hypothetical protein [Pseudomonadota bacterium]